MAERRIRGAPRRVMVAEVWLLAAVIAIFVLVPAGAVADPLPGAWRSIGAQVDGTPVGDAADLAGRVSAVAIIPGSPATEVVGTLGGIWKRTGKGPWTDVTSSSWPATAVNSIAVDPRHHQILYAGTGWDDVDYWAVQPGDGVLKSVNGGKTWTPLKSSEAMMYGFAVTGLAVDPGNDRIVVAAANNGIFRSVDAGQSWSLVRAITSGPLAPAEIHLAVDPVTGNMLAGVAGGASVAAHLGGRTIETGHAVYESTDGGETWIPYSVDSGTGPGAVLVPAIATTTGRTHRTFAYALDITGARGSGLYTSTNGRSWTFETSDNVVGKFHIGELVVNPLAPTTAYFAEEGGPYGYSFGSHTAPALSSRNGTSCTFGDFRALAVGQSISNASHSAVYGGDDGGSCYFDTTGRTFTNNNKGLISGLEYDVVARSATDELSGAQDLGVDKFSGQGASREIYHADGYGVLIDSSDPSTYYAAVNPPASANEFVVSTDAGARWNILPLSPAPGVVFDPTLRLIQATGDPSVLVLPARFALYVSTDGGSTWSAHTIPDGGDELTAVKAARFPGASQPVIYAGTYSGVVWRSTDLGASWTEVKSFAPLTVNDLALNPAGSTASPGGNRLYVGLGVGLVWDYHSFSSDGEAWESSDSGSSWSEIGQALSHTSVNALLISGSTLVAGTDHGVVKYSGGTWSPAGTALPNVRVNDLQLSADGKAFFAGTYGRGTWEAPAVTH
jgi:hypothetical protein